MNKTIVVTGGTKGIGRAIIEKFSQHGFDIATCSRNQQELESLKTTIHEEVPATNIYSTGRHVGQKSE